MPGLPPLRQCENGNDHGHNSPIPLQKWTYSIYLDLNSPKGIPSTQLARYSGIMQKSAWQMLQRI